jgi:hypothetical protein
VLAKHRETVADLAPIAAFNLPDHLHERPIDALETEFDAIEPLHQLGAQLFELGRITALPASHQAASGGDASKSSSVTGHSAGTRTGSGATSSILSGSARTALA